MKEKIVQTLKELRAYAVEKTYHVDIFYHEENSHLMRFANSAISLNTNEHIIRLDVTAYDGKKRASYELITNLKKIDEMKKAIDTAAEMVQHSQPLLYQPTKAIYQETYIDESAYDSTLAGISNEERLDFFNAVAKGLETDEIKLSGIFSSGANTIAMINTASEHLQYFKTSDAQVTAVLAHSELKWEVIAEQSAQNKADLDPKNLQENLAYMVERYEQDNPVQLPLGNYDVVFGQAAISDMINFVSYIGFNGGLMKRGFSFMSEEKVGEKVLSEKFTLTDDSNRLETFPFKRDYYGIERKPYPLFEKGVFKGFTWIQDEADEFEQEATGHTVHHNSLVVNAGDMEVSSIKELVEMPREKDILYIPFLHYMNIVNPSEGIITATSRFGALYLKKDGSIEVPYNVRLTRSLLEIFGDKVEWLSKKSVAYNQSNSYGARNPTAIVVPAFMMVNDLEISHSNTSY